MIKRIIGVNDVQAGDASTWIDLKSVADVDVTSENAEYPVENLFGDADLRGWRAGAPGAQLIRLRFHEPVRVNRILLVFEETADTRTQQFVVRWRAAESDEERELVRQQFTFAPPFTVRETEDYRTNGQDVAVLELAITPDMNGGTSIATLQRFCIA